MSNLDRAAGAVVGMAAGDALGAGYEFGPPLSDDTAVAMKGGGGFNWAPGEWTDDTSMAVPILSAIASGKDLRDESVQDELVTAWVEWAKTAPDVGIQLGQILRRTEPSAAAIRAVAKAHHELNGRSAGNGSLMRTAPVALAYLGDPAGLTVAARAISDLTHFEADAGDACVIWCHAIRHAILTGELRLGVDELPENRQKLWADRIAVAEERQPSDFAQNGWVVEALQGAWSAIVHAPSTDAHRLRESLENAVRGGRDTDTVAAIAGGLIGAVHGVSAVPAEWRRIIHGWPGLRAIDLQRLALQAVTGEAALKRYDYASWAPGQTLVRHPHDDGVWLGEVGALDVLPTEIDAVVSLCRVGTEQIPGHVIDHVEVWLIDKDDPAHNPNLDFVLADAADAIAALRVDGRTVLVHCVQAFSRTPTVGALYSARHLGVPIGTAFGDVQRVLPNAHPRTILRDAAERVGQA